MKQIDVSFTYTSSRPRSIFGAATSVFTGNLRSDSTPSRMLTRNERIRERDGTLARKPRPGRLLPFGVADTKEGPLLKLKVVGLRDGITRVFGRSHPPSSRPRGGRGRSRRTGIRPTRFRRSAESRISR